MSGSDLESLGIFNDPRMDVRGVDQYESSTGEVLGAVWDDTIDTNPVNYLDRMARRWTGNSPTLFGFENPFFADSELLSAEEANKRYGITVDGRRLLGWDSGTTVREREAKELRALKEIELQRESIIRRGRGGVVQTGAKFFTGLGASMLDPLNLLMGTFPFVREIRGATILGRAAWRAGIGAAEGAVGTAMLEPIIAAGSTAEQREYTWATALENVLYGSVFGSVAHPALGGAMDAYRRMRGAPVELQQIASITENAPGQTQAAMMRVGMIDTLEGRPVRVELPLIEHLLDSSIVRSPAEHAQRQFEAITRGIDEITTARTRIGQTRDQLVAARAELDRLRATGADPVAIRAVEDRIDTLMDDAGWNEKALRDMGIDPNSTVDPPPVEAIRKQVQAQAALDTASRAVQEQTEALATLRATEGVDPARISEAESRLTEAKRIETERQAELERAGADIPAMIRREADALTEAKNEFLARVDRYLEERTNPVNRISADDARLVERADLEYQRARGAAEAERQPGGKTQQSMLEAEVADLRKRIADMDAVGELGPQFRDEIDQLNAAAAQIERANLEATALEKMYACMR
ncbi:MAG: hypothetical protein KF889_04865 [Alphaproteobacteria bacterium]|nr:hypothetical protein [Alphaproteobacteria bacterium]MCW5742200.1 hypothetical protein [Alphaproteobacteria bacterium]